MASLKRRTIAGVALFVALVAGLAAVFTIRNIFADESRKLSAQAQRIMQIAQQSFTDEAMLGSLASTFDARLTVMEASGNITYDSDGILGYYMDQVDVAQALTKKSGERAVYSYFTGRVEVNHSIRLETGDILRVGLWQNAYSSVAWGALLAFVLVIILLGALFVLFISRQLLWPIQYVTRYAEQIVNGDATVDKSMRTSAEIQQLVYSLETMSGRLKDTVEELRQKNAELGSIINSMFNGLIAVDEHMNVVRMNQAAKRMLSVKGSTTGKSLLEVTGNAKLESILLEAIEKDEKLMQVELPVRANPGHTLLRVYISGFELEGESVGAVALLEDITQLRNLEQMRTDFAANVTHELKTPLTSIQGFVETLQAGAVNDPETAQYFLNIIAVESDRLYRLINDILSVSSLEAGRVRVPTKRLSLGQYAHEAVQFLGNAAQAKEIELSIDEDEDSFITANEDHVKQLLINLIENAIKYTLNGGSVFVSVKREGGEVVFRVRDTGIGIESEHISRLFERFYRVDKGRSRSMGGTGLGLAIVKHLVLEMNGRIDVESKIGVGSEFIVHLPYAGDGGDAK